MCLSDNINDNINNNTNNNISAIYEKYLNKSEIKSISHYFSFVQCNIKILENRSNFIAVMQGGIVKSGRIAKQKSPYDAHL